VCSDFHVIFQVQIENEAQALVHRSPHNSSNDMNNKKGMLSGTDRPRVEDRNAYMYSRISKRITTRIDLLGVTVLHDSITGLRDNTNLATCSVRRTRIDPYTGRARHRGRDTRPSGSSGLFS
jgi:hypothetical protein